MAHAFAPIPAKPTFGTLRKNLYQSDYLARKTASIIYCNSRATCGKLIVAKDYKERTLFKNGQDFLNELRCSKFNIPVGNSNLIMGQYTKLNLRPICSVANNPNNGEPISLLCYDKTLNCGTINVNPSQSYDPYGNTIPFYQNHYIDPCGELFGNSQCGELNFTSLMVFNPPDYPVL
jgi:hypothetical protein